MESVGGSTGAGFLAESKVNATNHLALFVQNFECGLHLAIEEHPAIDLDALFPVEIFRFADRWDARGEIAFNPVTYLITFPDLTDGETGFFQAVIENSVLALVYVRGVGDWTSAAVRIERACCSPILLLGHALRVFMLTREASFCRA